MSVRRFPPPWTVETIPGGLKVCDLNGQSLAYVYSRENRNDAHIAKSLTLDEARRIASNMAQAEAEARELEKLTPAVACPGCCCDQGWRECHG